MCDICKIVCIRHTKKVGNEGSLALEQPIRSIRGEKGMTVRILGRNETVVSYNGR